MRYPTSFAEGLKCIVQCFCFLLILFILGCGGNSEGELKIYLESLPVKDGIVKDWNKYHVFREEGLVNFVTLTHDTIKFYELNSNKPFKVVNIPKGFSDRDQITVASRGIWAMRNDSLFYISVNEKEKYLVPEERLDRDMEVARSGFFEIWKKKSRLLFRVINHSPDNKEYKYDFRYVGYWDYHRDSVGLLSLNYAPLYGEGEYGEPRVYLTTIDSCVLVSENYNSYITVIDFEEGLRTVQLRHGSESMTELPKLDSDSKKSKYESALKNQVFAERYGPTFKFREHSEFEFLRIYIHNLNEKDKLGYFNSLRDSRTDVLIKMKNGQTLTGTLPYGRYFNNKYWFFSNDTLYYPKWLKKDEFGGHTYVVDRISFGLQ